MEQIVLRIILSTVHEDDLKQYTLQNPLLIFLRFSCLVTKVGRTPSENDMLSNSHAFLRNL